MLQVEMLGACRIEIKNAIDGVDYSACFGSAGI